MASNAIFKVLEALENPHLRLNNVIRLVGTTGKTSIASYINAIALEAGYKVNTLFAGNIPSMNQIISINGSYLEDNEVSAIIANIQTVANDNNINLTDQETISIAGLHILAENEADLQIIESWEGNKDDPIHVLNDNQPILTVLTKIGVDHSSITGNTAALNAITHSSFITPNTHIISSRQSKEVIPFLNELSFRQKNNLKLLDRDFWLDLTEGGFNFSTQSDAFFINHKNPKSLKDFQIENIATAIMTIHELEKILPDVNEDHVKSVLEKIHPKGQMEKLHIKGELKNSIKNDLYLSFATNQLGYHSVANFLRQLSKKEGLTKNNYLLLKPHSTQTSNCFSVPLHGLVRKCIILQPNPSSSKEDQMRQALGKNMSLNFAKDCIEGIRQINALDCIARIIICGDASIAKQLDEITE